ncbi:MAG: ATP-dependent zinc metalloprotease FtsH [Halobacteriovoraceae bacterium]|nr:ATP-dependent zinc metalloprotease FtsH [Halobacteriovoraceae bacterium]
MKNDKKPRKNSADLPTNPKFNPKNLSLWFFILLASLFVANLVKQEASTVTDKSYSEILAAVKAGRVSEVVFKGDSLRVQIVDGEKQWVSLLPPLKENQLLNHLEEKGIKIVVKEDDSGNWTMLLVNLLPWVFIIGFFYYSSRSIQKRMGDMGKPPFMGKEKSHEVDVTMSKVTFEDVAGSKNAKLDLLEIVDFLKKPEKFQKMGAQLPRGVLMVGPPGTGKTLMAKAVAGEAGVPFFSISGSEFIEMFVGVGASRVRKLFEEAKVKSPAIIFIDEIDSIGRSRGTGLGGGHDEREQTLNQILAEMDGFGTGDSVVVLAATNRPDVLDSALVRPGRFDRQVVMDLPMLEARKAILGIHAKKIPIQEKVDLNIVAKETPGFSGAELKNLVNEATLIATRAGKDLVSQSDFSMARDKVIMGNPRDEHLSEKQKKVVAVHESGHALVALLTEHTSPVRKMTIIPRGRALGFTEQVHEEDKVNQTRSELLSQIAVLLGGRVAEELSFSEITTGAQDDLKRATNLARKMVANFGMVDDFGLLSFDFNEEHSFLGKDLGKPRNFSEETARKMDHFISELLQERKKYVTNILTENKEKLDSLSVALFDKETLEGDEIYSLVGLQLQP